MLLSDIVTCWLIKHKHYSILSISRVEEGVENRFVEYEQQLIEERFRLGGGVGESVQMVAEEARDWGKFESLVGGGVRRVIGLGFFVE